MAPTCGLDRALSTFCVHLYEGIGSPIGDRLRQAIDLPLAIRRLRDAGKHWAWIFITLIPLIGAIWLIYLLVQPSVG